MTPAFEKIGCVCRDHDYHNFLFSMKASNPLVMVQAYRLLSEEMYLKGWDYPLHLGVTEVNSLLQRPGFLTHEDYSVNRGLLYVTR